MSEVPVVTSQGVSVASASGSEKRATLPKSQSCMVCRSRKVRCDRQSPCSACRRANVACVLPATDRAPKWAHRLDRRTNNAAASNAPLPQGADPAIGKVIDRLRNLETLVKELSGEARAAAGSAGASSSKPHPGRSTHDRNTAHQSVTSSLSNASSVQKHVGRLVLQHGSRSRYVSSGFWSRVNDELDGLKLDTRGLAGDDFDSSDEEISPEKSPSTQELERTPSDRYAFLFRHSLSPADRDLHEFHPLPSQIPFLLQTFAENVNFLTRTVHIPTVTEMVRDLRGSDMTRFTPANEALMFSMYYTAITSMEEDEVMINFGSSKTDLNLKYRLGLEHALAKADFLDAPDIVLVQAFVLFLFLVRRHESPRFVWMMTGLLIRMAQYLGLQRDGAHFEHLTPFEIEMRRRVWWNVCLLDLRASEDQGTDLTITRGSFDTRSPLNINDADINPESKEMPPERDGVTDMSFLRIEIEIWDITTQMMAPGVRNGAAGLEDQNRLLDEIYQKYEQGYLKFATESGNIAYWVGVTIARLVIGKMTLIGYLPVLFSSPSEHFSDEIRTKLLVAAIEVAEDNHALNTNQACRQWRWIYQTYTHWHAIVYLMIEISRRPWSTIVERAWSALHSSWLIPAQASMSKNSRMWFPLRGLMSKARKHRDAELDRLRADPQAAARLDIDDQKIPMPSSSGALPTGSSVDIFRERWRELVATPEHPGDGTQTANTTGAALANPPIRTAYTAQPTRRPVSAYNQGYSSSGISFQSTYLPTNDQQASQYLQSTNIKPTAAITTNTPSHPALVQASSGLSCNAFPRVLTYWSDGRTDKPGLLPWLWADTDPSIDVFPSSDVDALDVNMELDGDVNWYDWVESAKGMEWDQQAHTT